MRKGKGADGMLQAFLCLVCFVQVMSTTQSASMQLVTCLLVELKSLVKF